MFIGMSAKRKKAILSRRTKDKDVGIQPDTQCLVALCGCGLDFPLPLHPSVRPLAQPCLLVVRRVNFLTINAWHNKIE